MLTRPATALAFVLAGILLIRSEWMGLLFLCGAHKRRSVALPAGCSCRMTLCPSPNRFESGFFPRLAVDQLLTRLPSA